MVDENLKWDKQQNMDDENQETTHNIEFLKKAKIHHAAKVYYFSNFVKAEMGIDEKSNLPKN